MDSIDKIKQLSGKENESKIRYIAESAILAQNKTNPFGRDCQEFNKGNVTEDLKTAQTYMHKIAKHKDPLNSFIDEAVRWTFSIVVIIVLLYLSFYSCASFSALFLTTCRFCKNKTGKSDVNGQREQLIEQLTTIKANAFDWKGTFRKKEESDDGQAQIWTGTFTMREDTNQQTQTETVSIYSFAQLLVYNGRFRERFMNVIYNLKTRFQSADSAVRNISVEIRPVLSGNHPVHMAIIGKRDNREGLLPSQKTGIQFWKHLSSNNPFAFPSDSKKSILIYPELPKGCTSQMALETCERVRNLASFIGGDDQDHHHPQDIKSRHYLLIMLGINIKWYLKNLHDKNLNLPICISTSGLDEFLNWRVDQFPKDYQCFAYKDEFERLIKTIHDAAGIRDIYQTYSNKSPLAKKLTKLYKKKKILSEFNLRRENL